MVVTPPGLDNRNKSTVLCNNCYMNNAAIFARVCGVGVLAYASYAICRTPLLPLLARDLGASAPMVGLVMAASTLTGVMVKLPAGAWSDVLGRRPLLIAATVIFAVMPFSYLAAGTIAALVALRFVHGSATAIMGPVMAATISDLAPPDRRATWLSTYSTVQGAGQAIAPVVAGLLIAARRYDAAFVLAGSIALVTPFLVRRLPLPHRPAASTAPLATRVIDGILEVVRERRILLASVTHAAYFVMNGTLNAFLPLFARDVIGMTAVGIGWMFGVQTVTTLAIRPLVGMASDRLGRRGAISAGLVTCGAGVWMIAVAADSSALFLAVLLYAAGVAITTAATSAYITDVAPRARFGAAHGVFGTIYDVGDAGGPLLGGLLVAGLGYAVTFQLMAAMAILTAAAFAWLSRKGDTVFPERQ
jgi:DHA1 family multidrug resistance protein-like MFS transporter